MDKKDEIRPVRFTADQVETMTKAATMKKRTLTDWIRWCAVTASEKVINPKGNA